MPEDWRGQAIADLPADIRDKGAKWLERRSDLTDALKSGISADTKISELQRDLQGRLKPIDESSTPEEISAYREALGIPAEPGKYEIYTPAQGWDTGTKAAIDEFLAVAHTTNMSQTQVESALRALDQARNDTMMELNQRAQQTARQTTEALRQEFGRSTDEKIVLANRWAAATWGTEAAPDVMSIRLADGSCLGDNLNFVKGIIGLAANASDMGVLEIGDAAVTQSRDGRLDELYALKSSDPKRYQSKGVQDEIYKLEASKQAKRR